MSLLPDDIPLRLRAIHEVLYEISQFYSLVMKAGSFPPSWTSHLLVQVVGREPLSRCSHRLTSVNPVDKMRWAKIVEAWNQTAGFLG